MSMVTTNLVVGGNGDRIHRHDAIKDALFSVAQTAALAPRKEVPFLISGTSSRPANVHLPIWKKGRPDYLNVSVISTMQHPHHLLLSCM